MITIEKLKHHIKHLQEQHAELDKQVDKLELTGNFKDADLAYLKKRRLYIKDEIAVAEAKIEKLKG